MNHKNDKLFGALIGLAKAAEGKVLEKSSGEALIDGLNLAFAEENIPESSRIEMIERLHTEKTVMSPDCSTCQYPCGRTDDFDMDEVYSASEPLRDAKLELLSLLGAASQNHDAAEIGPFLAEALFLISCSFEAGQLTKSIERAGQLKQL